MCKNNEDVYVQLLVGTVRREELTPWYSTLISCWREGDPSEYTRVVPPEAEGSLVDTMRVLER